jgi:hypothetical protein
MGCKALMVFTAMVVGFAVSPASSAKTNLSGAGSSFQMGGPSGWLTTDSGKHYRFVSMGTSTRPHIFRIGEHDASEVKSITWKDCCNVDAVLLDGTSEVVNASQINDVYRVDGTTVMMSYGVDGLPVTVVSAATGATKVVRFPNLAGIKSIRFDRPGSKQWLAARHRYSGADQRSLKVDRDDGAIADRSTSTGSTTATSSQAVVSDGTTMQCGTLGEFGIHEASFPAFAVSSSSTPQQISVYTCLNGDNDCVNPKLDETGNFDRRGRLVRYQSPPGDMTTWRYSGASDAPIEETDVQNGLGTTITKYKRSTAGFVLGEWITHEYPKRFGKPPATSYQPGPSISKQGDVIVTTDSFDHVPGTQGVQHITRTYSGGLLRASTLPMLTFTVDRQAGHIIGSSTPIKTYRCEYAELKDGTRSTTELVETDDGQLLPDAKTVFDASGRPILDVMVMGEPGSPGTTVRNTMYYYLTTDVEGNWTRRQECRDGNCRITIRKIRYWSQ